MRRSEAARYARWSAAVALLLASITVGVYLRRGWQRHTEQKAAPPPPPVNVEKQSSGLTFSKMDGPRKIFTVEASKSTDFKNENASLLENVKVTIFGKAGDRHDTIHTQSCQYHKEKGSVVCTGAVEIVLQSAADAENAAKHPAVAPQVVHIETSSVTFNNGSGDATTSQPVTFAFPSGTGEAVGAQYNSGAGTLRLLHDVDLNLKPPSPKNRAEQASRVKPDEGVRVTGSSLDFGRDAHILHISGPAEAQSTNSRLAAGDLTLELDETFRARRLLAMPSGDGKPPELTSKSASGSDAMHVIADKLTAEFAPEGWITRLQGDGSVHGGRKTNDEDDEFHAATASLDMWPRLNRAKELNLNGGVLLKTHASKTGDARVLQTGALRMLFSEGSQKQSGKPTNAETLTAGSMDWTDSTSQPSLGPAHTKLQADKLRLAFGPEGKPTQLDAQGNVQMERALAGQPLQTATAKTGVAQLLASGGWSQMDLQDDVKLKESDRSAQSDHATFVRAAQTALLSGHAMVRDAATETHAPRVLFYQTTGDIYAEGGVRSADFGPSVFASSPSATPVAQLPANITSDTLRANSKTGRALYAGHARLWQGDSVLEADSIELLRETKLLNARGSVRGVFPQTSAGPTGVAAPSAKEPSRNAAANHKKPMLWHVSSATLTYSDLTSTAHLEKNVVVQSPDQRIRAPGMDLYFTRTDETVASPNTVTHASAANAPDASPTNVMRARQISRAVGTGGVIVDEGDRRATAERGEYTAADGKFVMSGGTPTLYDSTEGTTTGRQLTFFLADDTIIVDSENGSRTLTKHRVNATPN